MTEDERVAARDILNFIQKQPNAKHTAEGIAKYWIFQQRVEERVEIVMAAIDFLVQNGFLDEVQKPNGNSFYRVNKRKVVDIPVALTKLQENEDNT